MVTRRMDPSFQAQADEECLRTACGRKINGVLYILLDRLDALVKVGNLVSISHCIYLD
jgi:hypothetical protein